MKAVLLDWASMGPDLDISEMRTLLPDLTLYDETEPGEVAALPVLARGAAMRFLLTRLYDWLNTPADAFVTRKDPLEYWKKLNFHMQVRGPESYGLE